MKKILLSIVLLFGIFALSSCGEKISGDEIKNPDADFIFYHWKTCPHCVELDKVLVEKDIYSKNILAKKEVWYNHANQAEFTALTTKLGLAPEDVWVPFLYVKSTQKHYIGQGNIVPILEAAVAKLWTTPVEKETSSQTIDQ